MQRILYFCAAISASFCAIAQEPFGVVRGTVRDAATGATLPNAAVVVERTQPQVGAATDSLGRFIISQVAVGLWSVKASIVGYEAASVHEVWVRSGKESVLEFALSPARIELQPVVVGVVDRWQIAHSAVVLLTVEQGLRYPAMFQDPARLLTATPSVAAPNDQANHLMVRGNGPLANTWLLEGAEMVCPNHLGNAGTASDLPTLTGGGVSILSAQMLGPSSLRTGSMPASHGNALGGITDLSLRQGNAQEREWTVQAGLIGIDVSAEGPITKRGKDFHLVNYRYSTLGLLSAMGVDIGDEAISFQDISFHAGSRIGERGEWRVFGLGGVSSNTFKAKADTAQWEFDKDSRDINYASSMGAVGATLKLPLGKRSLMHATALWSGAYQERSEYEKDTGAMAPWRDFASLYERKLSLVAAIEGPWGKWLHYTVGGSAMERMLVNVLADTAQGWLLRPFAQVRATLPGNIVATVGMGYSHYTYNLSGLLEPRIDLLKTLRGKGAVLLSAGVRGQLPQHAVINLSDLSSASTAMGVPDNRALGFQRSEDLTVGYEHRVDYYTSVRAEAYGQRITRVPVPWSGLNITGLQEPLTNAWDEPQYLPMEASAETRNLGVELSVKQAMSKGFYWLMNGSVFRSTTVADGVERRARWDAGWTANAMAGKEWSRSKEDRVRSWGVGLRALGVGGLRYTPFEAQWRTSHWAFITGEPFSARLHDVYRIDLRVYLKRDRDGRTGLWAIDVQNVANTRNEAYKAFDFRKGETITRYQLGLIPNLSYRIEF